MPSCPGGNRNGGGTGAAAPVEAPARGAAPLESAVVVAHPDDEILWLSGPLGSADRVVFCFGDPFGRPKLAAARRRAVAALALPRLVELRIPESGARFAADWGQPRLTRCGIDVIDAAARARYEANFTILVDRLRPLLRACRDVYTHNPWGEYGHTEHIQVYRAVAALQAELGFTIWFGNYVAARSWPLARAIGRAPCWTARRTIAPDLATARRLARLYRRHGAWTWSRFHRWPAEEVLYAQPSAAAGDARRALSGEVLCDVAALRWWAPWRTAARRLD
ncbi:MAG: PIG-L family deacetylase [Rhodospirillales bacterium]|jgi:LmbE family N-acetylglucosaminyl deacetylase|nr:PIG-L family deacetylase [Rhodospirillales bacterium]